MTEENVAHKAFREYEKEIDIHHRSLPLWSRHPNAAAYSLMAAFDILGATELLRNADSGYPEDETAFKYLEEGLTQALRWFWTRKPHLVPSPVLNLQIIEEAKCFLQAAGSYACVSDFHMLASRGLCVFRVDPERRRVRFDFPSEYQARHAADGFVGQKSALDLLFFPSSLRQCMDAMERALGRGWAVREGIIEIEGMHRLASWATEGSVKTTSDQEILPLEHGADLGGFTVDEFRLFWSALERWSMTLVLAQIENLASGVRDLLCRPTQVHDMDRFMADIGYLSGLDSEVSEGILKRLAFGNYTCRPDAFLQPLVVSQRTVAWSPYVIVSSRSERNMLKLMARTPELKAIADNLIGSRESALLGEISRLLCDAADYRLVTNRTLSCGDKKGS